MHGTILHLIRSGLTWFNERSQVQELLGVASSTRVPANVQKCCNPELDFLSYLWLILRPAQQSSIHVVYRDRSVYAMLSPWRI